MELIDKLTKETILIPMHASTKEDAIQELLNHLFSLDILSGTVKLFTNINEREKLYTSSTGRGVAYPHSTSMEINDLKCILGISKKGIDFNSPDGHSCHLILLTLSPINEPKDHIKFITRFRLMVDDPMIRSNLLDSNNSIDIINIISDWEDEYKKEVI